MVSRQLDKFHKDNLQLCIEEHLKSHLFFILFLFLLILSLPPFIFLNSLLLSYLSSKLHIICNLYSSISV